ncbi:hypothetical protein [Lentzea sp. NEAU-D7]|uniref:hypothetical protein n=1 Tax=Lentzea sp. NEAU-D7 TaxID=2994667 RepID=UPI00224B28DF|nr:hypothetical protein [Lentzea sp. NEAU-D7]MCX2949915.1 hypothetical protein [Lentzea sp. NEAU-D7]
MSIRLLRKVLALVLVTGLTMTNLPVVPLRELQEDDPGWICQVMGNRFCGPADQLAG